MTSRLQLAKTDCFDKSLGILVFFVSIVFSGKHTKEISPLAPSSSACLLYVDTTVLSESAKPLKSALKCTVNLLSLGVLWSYEKKTIKVKPE